MLETYIAERRSRLEDHLESFVGSIESGVARVVVSHLLRRGQGKRLRGLTAILVCEALGGRAEDALVAAEAVELAHQTSLAKDDFIDRDSDRRGEPAFWTRVSEMLPQLFNRQFTDAEARDLRGMATMMLADVIVPHATLLTQRYGLLAVLTVVTAWGKVASGQAKDMGLASLETELGEKAYLDIISEKTAALYEAPADLGARAANKPWHCNMARGYGFAVGIAFQAADDLVDLWRGRGRPWRALGKGRMMPHSLKSLQVWSRGSLDLESTVEQADFQVLEDCISRKVAEAEQVARLFPDLPARSLLQQFPSYCVEQMKAEGQVRVASG